MAVAVATAISVFLLRMADEVKLKYGHRLVRGV